LQKGNKPVDLNCEERLSDSTLSDRVWRAQSEGGGNFISVANPHWGIVVTRWHGNTLLTVRGPETKATPAVGLPDAEFFGIQFRLGTLMPHLPPQYVMDRQDITLPNASSRSFWLQGAAWEFPDYDNAETFVKRLAETGLLVGDTLVRAALEGEPLSASLRTVQRRFLRATGITHNDVYQIQRARQAARLLKDGASILDTVEAAGYYDQPHLTKSLRALLGLTPAQLAPETQRAPLSFLYKS
jgi:hypothetical protein